MKSCFRWMAMVAASLCFEAAAQGRQYDQPYGGGAGFAPTAAYQPDGGMANGMPFQTELASPMPGRLWLEFSLADRGLGYSGSYFTLGGKTRLWDDIFDGRWLFEGQGHVSLDSGGFFCNAGIERVFSIRNAGSDVVVGGWFDYDSDQQGSFAHTFSQFSVNGAIKTRRWDLIGNGYFPVGVTDYTAGDPTGAECFFRNSIVLQPGIDSALRGFDAMLRYRPAALGLVNGTLEVGGYQYGSDLIDDFGGVRLRMGMQVLRGLMIAGEVNHDNRFDVTSVVQLGWQFGMNARGNEYAGLGRDLEPTYRNDHIVRFNQDIVLAIDPDTGRPYNVFHVDNLADAAIGNGTRETPFATLAEAQGASGADDIIFVHTGDFTDRNYDNGIVLKDGQLLLGDGVRHLIPIQNGQIFQLCNIINDPLSSVDFRPRLSNDGGNVVTLANRNTVRGVIIEGNGLAVNGISGNAFPFGPPITDGIIEDTTITDPILSGVLLDTIAGDWRFARNDISGAGLFDGITIRNACDATSTFVFEDNFVHDNARDGIHMMNFDGTSFTFTRNRTNSNGRDGIHLEGYKNTSGTGGEFVFASPISNNNIRNGIYMQDVDGNVQILNPSITGNLNAGIELVNVTNSQPGDATFIGPTGDGTSNLSGNNIGLHIDLNAPGATQNVTMTRTTINNSSQFGILSEASGVGTQLTTNVFDNISVSGSGASGMRFTSTGGAFHRVIVENPAFDRLVMNGNGAVAGNGIDLLVGDNTPGQISSMNATLRNIDITNTGGVGIFSDVEQNGQLTLLAEDIDIIGSSSGVVSFFDTNATNALNSIRFDGVNVDNVGGDGVILTVQDESFVDYAFVNGRIRDNWVRLAPAPEPFWHGFQVNVSGGANTLARIMFQNNFVGELTPGNFGFTNDAIQVTTAGASHTLMTIDGNTINNNGPGSDETMLPYFDAVDVVVGGASEFSLNLTNNTMIANWEQSFNLVTTGLGSNANVFLSGNTMRSDFGEDQPVPQTSALVDVLIRNVAGSTMCVSMSNNATAFGTVITNSGAAAALKLELDGLTNGVVTVPNPVMQVPFGSTCQPAISAEEAFFVLNGFPPQ